jgi:FKBP-type peptidyl-prolyl cis-trans isomerase 2
MKIVKKSLMKASPCLPLIAMAISGCTTVESTRIVKTGDQVGVHFTCRQKTGEIASSTYADVNNSSLPKSALFEKRTLGDPVVIEAGKEITPSTADNRKSFEEEIMARLAKAVVGMREQEGKSIEITADPLAGLPPKEQFIKVVRVWKQPKEMKLSLNKYKALANKDPVVGDSYAIYKAVPGKVISVTGDEILLRFAPTEEETDLAFGKGVIREKDDHYEIDIHAVKGTLVRAGGLAGRISDVDADNITLDFGQPLGGETLRCDVKVEAVQAGKKNTTAGDVKVDKNVEKALNGALAKAVAEKGQGSASDVKSGTVQRGDLVTVNYTAALEDGSIFGTTLESAAKDPTRKKASWFREPAHYRAVEILAGKEEIEPGLGDAVLGLGVGAKKQIRLTPDKAFGQPDPQKEVKLPCVRTFPRVVRLPADEYVKRFSSFPVLNKEVDLVPYFKARVSEVKERDVALEFLVKDGAIFTDNIGKVTVKVEADRITTTLKPVIGAEFPIKDSTGVITATDGTTFTVDTNNPLAGKSIVVDLAVVSMAKAATLQTKPIDWIDEYDTGLAQAKKEGKPVFLLLYADWCGWCKKTLTETIPDPRIKRYKDKFIWVKVNSDKETKFKKQYGQNGFPMVVILKPDGTVLKKIAGYHDAFGLNTELEGTF